jgi:hypothetical protein
MLRHTLRRCAVALVLAGAAVTAGGAAASASTAGAHAGARTAAVSDAVTTNAAVPDAATRNAVVPGAAVPHTAAANDATPDITTPNTVTLNTVVPNAVVPNAVVPNAVTSNTVTSNIVRPFTGTGCHTYNFWSGAQVCITVYGSGLHVDQVSGETDGPDSDWGELWDSDGVVTIYGHPTNHYLTVNWSSGGGVWLPQNDNFCFTDTTLRQTACLLVHS